MNEHSTGPSPLVMFPARSIPRRVRRQATEAQISAERAMWDELESGTLSVVDGGYRRMPVRYDEL